MMSAKERRAVLAAAYLRLGDRALITARDAHRERTGHSSVVAYGNFVECAECGAHAHLMSAKTAKPTLYLHDRDYQNVREIYPIAF
jgi:hypothetical protein